MIASSKLLSLNDNVTLNKIPSIINLRVILSVSFIRFVFTNILFISLILITDLSQN